MSIRLVVAVAVTVLLMGCGQGAQEVAISGKSDEAFHESLKSMASTMDEDDQRRLVMELADIAEAIIPPFKMSTMSDADVLEMMKKTLDGKNRGDISKMAIMLM